LSLRQNPSVVQQVPLWQIPLQHSLSAVQEPTPFGMHIGVVEVLVDVEVVLLVEVLVVVVVVCAWQLPLEQFPLQHWLFLLQCLPLRLRSQAAASSPFLWPPDMAFFYTSRW